MRAVLYERFGATPELRDVPDPSPPADGAVVEVRANGICRSDWHAWIGHDPGVRLPHVPGHEFAGVVTAVGADVRRFHGGERVTSPFVAGCGQCPECRAGEQQVCREQTQPGFTHWGSFARYVVVHHADVNLVVLPDVLDFAASASLGCRFVTAFRALVHQGRVRPHEWVAVHGCGGAGLSAVMIAVALGANVVGVDVDEGALARARALGARATIDARKVESVAAAVMATTEGGAHLSIDAFGSAKTCVDSIRCLRRSGRHVQVGLLLGDEADPALPMGRVIAYELRLLGCHGMAAHRYDEMLAMVVGGRLAPERLLGRSVSLEESIGVLTQMDRASSPGVTVITEF